MDFLPVCISVKNQAIVIIGGGKVAAQKLRTLMLTSARIKVYAQAVSGVVRAMPVEWKEEPYCAAQLDGAQLVYACTSDKLLNRTIACDARKRRIPVCAADDIANCDFISPAVWKSDVMTVAVGSNGTDPRRAVAWRNAIRKWGEHDTALR